MCGRSRLLADGEQPCPNTERRSAASFSGTELVTNGSFEDGIAPWEQDTGGPCEVLDSGATITAPAGSRYLHGGTPSEPRDCRAWQEVDLLARGFTETQLDRGDLSVDAEVWLANAADEGSFDDQSWLQLWYLDEAGETLGSLRTLIGGDDDWRLRRASGMVPAGTRSVRVEVNGRQHTDDGNEAWYSFTYGDVFFVVLDTEAPTGADADVVDQRAFLEAALSSDDAQAAAWRVVTFHRPPYTNARHDRTSTGDADVRGDWVPLFEGYDVDLVVCGHKHSYQRGTQNDVTYVIAGGGGAALDDEVIELYSFLDVVELSWHYAVMDADAPALVWTTYDADDNVLDSFTLTR